MATGSGVRIRAGAYTPVSITVSLLVVTSTLFFTFTCPWLAENVSLAFPACVGITFLFALANFTMATFMDAGVLPRANEDEDKDDDPHAPLFKDVEVRGIQFQMKWCASCNFYRPPRCSHCSVCDHCVENFDHHCPWVNNCIGRRNYRFFFLFLLALSMHMVAIFSGGLLYVLAHLETLWELRATVTLSIMSMSAIFLIPVMGLACFHMVLVATGRTTNEQVTRKYKGIANPFTRGCCGNVEFLLCGPITPRYIGKLGIKQAVHIQHVPLKPFETLESLKMSSIKRQSSGELDVPEHKQLNTRPPMPPKHEPVLLKGHPAMLQESILQTNTSVPTAQRTADQIVESSPREQMDHQLHMSGFAQESGTWKTEMQIPISTHLPLHSSTFPINRLVLNSHSLTLKHSNCGGQRAHQCHDSATSSSSTQGILSLSYDSLINSAQRGNFKVNYLPPFLPLDLGMAIKRPADAQRASYRTCSPNITDTSRPYPVFYDSNSKPAMRSIQERHELEEQEKLSTQDIPVYDIPSGCILPFRRPTPPVYGSQEFLMSSAAYGYTSSLRRASRTSSSIVHANIALQSRSLSPSAYRSLEHHVQHSASSIPCPMPSSSYTAQKALAIITASEKKHSGP